MTRAIGRDLKRYEQDSAKIQQQSNVNMKKMSEQIVNNAEHNTSNNNSNSDSDSDSDSEQKKSPGRLKRWKKFGSSMLSLGSSINPLHRASPDKVLIYVAFAIGIHVIDGMMFGYNPATWLMVFIIYLSLFIVAIGVVFRESSQIVSLGILTMLAIAVPRITVLVFDQLNYQPEYLGTILLLFPAGVMLLPMFPNLTGDANIGRKIFIYMLIMFTFILLQNTSVYANYATYMPNVKIDFKDSLEGVGEVVNPEAAAAGIVDYGASLSRFLTSTFSINTFVGDVEDTQGDPVGLFLDMPTAVEKFTEGSEVFVAGLLSGENFKGEIVTINRCYAYDNDGKVFPGYIRPKTWKIYDDETRTIECVFGERYDNPLEPGKYTVGISINFDFSTWAYLTYYYMDRNVARAYGDEIYSTFDMPRSATSISTDGPAWVQMTPLQDRSMEMPIKVDSTNMLDSLFVSVNENPMWSGNIITVKELGIQVPAHIRFSSCSRDPSNVIEKEDGTAAYKFELNSFGSGTANSLNTASDVDFFRKISCRPEITDSNGFLGDGVEPVPATYAVGAQYNYLLSDTQKIEVLKAE